MNAREWVPCHARALLAGPDAAATVSLSRVRGGRAGEEWEAESVRVGVEDYVCRICL
jgi:hypothetical protein